MLFSFQKQEVFVVSARYLDEHSLWRYMSMFWKRTILLTLALLMICSAGIALTSEAIEACLERGANSRIFPDGTTADDLIVETYNISALDDSYTVCVVSTKEQRSDVEFGWLSIHIPSNSVVQSSRTRRSY